MEVQILNNTFILSDNYIDITRDLLFSFIRKTKDISKKVPTELHMDICFITMLNIVSLFKLLNVQPDAQEAGGFMDITIFGHTYHFKADIAKVARKGVLHFCDQVYKTSEERKAPKFYYTTIIMMYVISSSILQNYAAQDLSQNDKGAR